MQQQDNKKQVSDQQKEQDDQKRQAINNLAKNAFGNNQNAAPQGQKEGTGNQGNPEGNPNSNNFGTPGNGNGNGNGTGNGIGDGNGPGISASLFGRHPLFLAVPEKKIQKEGIVVVEVTVDKEGKVTQANAGVKGSTSLDENLLKAAKQAALNTRFDTKLDAPAFQKGTITYIFKLK